MKKVVFMGAKEIGLRCFRELLTKHHNKDCEIVGVITRKTNLDGEESIQKLCRENGIHLVPSLEHFLHLKDVDITISVQHNEILKREHIDKANDITLNLHLAPLPEYRGCNQFSFAIIDQAKWFGATIQEMNEGIDNGDILFERRFRMDDKKYWVSELYDRTVHEAHSLFAQSLGDLLIGNYNKTPQSKLVEERGTSIHYRKEIGKIKEIDLNWTHERIERHIRGTYMPGFPPPFTEIDGIKVHFVPEN